MPTQNLVQIQNDLQSLPHGPQTMMYLKRAKDGMVASVPPYLAAAELASREKQAMRQKLSSGAAPGEMPTVSQQLSQKADLLALQAMKKKEMDAASMNQARTASGPAPEGAPEPEEQPQPEGGLASLPVDFQFADGGIVAFTDGGPADKKKKKKPSLYDLSRDPLLQKYYSAMAGELDTSALPQGALEGDGADYSSPQAQIAAQRAGSALATPGAAMLDVLGAPYNALKGMVTHGGASMTPYFDQLREREAKAAQAEGQAQSQMPPGNIPPEILAAYGPNAQRMPQVQAPQQRPPAPPGPPQQRPPAVPGAQGAQGAAPQQPATPSPQDALQADLMRQFGITPGAPGAAAPGAPGAPAAGPAMGRTAEDIKAAQAAFGLDKAAGTEERRLIDEMRARHAQQQQERARLGLKGVLAGFSQGYGGAAAADVAATNRAYAEDMAHQKSMYDLINAINKGNRGEAEKAFEKTIGLQEKREQEAGATSRTELQAKVNMYGDLLKAGSSRYNTDMHYKAAMANARVTSDRAGLEDRKLKIDGLQSAERGIQQELTKLQGLMDKDSRQRRAELDGNLKALREQIARLSGVEPAAPSGTSPTQGRVVNWADIGKTK